MPTLRKTIEDSVEESKKKTKKEVHYRRSTAYNHCGVCLMFIDPGACTAVKGKINQDDLCDLFERKKK